MSLLVGDNKDKKEIAYMGLRHCSNCNSLTHFSLFEVESNYKVLFFKVPKFDKSHVFLCEKCGSGIEIENDRIKSIVNDFKHISSREECNTIFSEIETFMETKISEKDSLSSQIESLGGLKESVELKYEDNHVRHVFNAYSRYLKNTFSD